MTLTGNNAIARDMNVPQFLKSEAMAGRPSVLHQHISRASLALLLVLAGMHIAFTWGHVGILWGDPGRWLHEVDRLAHGEVLYRDFSWPYPPLALWLLGGLGRVFGSGTASIWTVMSVVFLLICLAYARYVHLLVPKPLALPTLLGGFLLACAYANVDSAPLPAGTYTPAAPVGLLLLLLAVICALGLLDGFRPIHAVGTGILCGLCILTKQDFWIPAGYLVAAGSIWLLSFHEARMRNLALLLCSTFLLTVLAGVVVVYAQAGGHALLAVPGGGQVAEFRGRTFPTGERLIIELIALALLGLFSVVLLLTGRTIKWKAARKWVALFGLVTVAGCSLHIFMSYRIGSDLRHEGLAVLPGETASNLRQSLVTNAQLLSGSLMLLKHNLLLHALPLFLPLSVLIIVLIRRSQSAHPLSRNMVLLLLGLCVAARLKRGFEHLDWYHCLLEIPVYVAAALLYLPAEPGKTPRALHLAMGLLLVFGGYSYWQWGVGPLARNNEFERVDTPRGRVWVYKEVRTQFFALKKLLDQADPSGKRPLFAFAYSGGFDYFLDRKNPTPVTQGFRLSIFDPDLVVRSVLSHDPAVLVLDTTRFDDLRFPSPNFTLLSWDLKRIPNPYTRFDRPYFLQILARCREVAKLRLSPTLLYTLYDCSQPPAG